MSTPSPTSPLSPSLAPKIASYAIQPPTGPTPLSTAIELSQAAHRIGLLNAAWSTAIRPGSRVLEIGCGQGTCTAVLAEAVSGSPSGHVDALDPAALDYGAPFTLGQAQAHLSAGPLGDRITFRQADPVSFLNDEARKDERWDAAVLAHCIWYFSSPSELSRILEALRGRVRAVCVAEYALKASVPAAVPHVLAALAQATLEAHKTSSHSNIQTPVGPRAIKASAARAGWKGVREEAVVEVESVVGDERVRTMLRTAREATVAAVEAGVAGGR
ncbi:hypothetical protein B0T17DRAFT_588446 [Bombardia bombarda]|uniref:Methyltransferase domain-containing protein n=1 Tax=Bombardia bombarda TaxID=252184 RepID=A0AA39X6L9_9PEZI|nr:hypothetical protein B0T17DRAFT_588446 [Bombardia bombarda]